MAGESNSILSYKDKPLDLLERLCFHISLDDAYTHKERILICLVLTQVFSWVVSDHIVVEQAQKAQLIRRHMLN